MAETILEQQVRRTEGQEFFSSDDVVGKRVKNPEGYDLGEISSLRVGLPTGRVAYAVLRTGGMFGLGAKHFAIPIEAMVYRPGDDVFVVNISKYRLDNEPGFSEGDWPREANWSLIESRRPVGPPSQEEARAVTRTEPPPREVVTTERVEVRERAPREEMPIRAEEVEESRTRTTVPVTGPPSRETVVEEVETRPVTEAHAPTLDSMMKAEDVEEGRVATAMPVTETAPREVERPTTTKPATGRLSAAGLQTYLAGMNYPAGRQDLVTHARQHDAPQSVLTTLEGFPDRTYRSAADVSAEFGGEARTRQPTGIETPAGEVRETRTQAPSLTHLSAADLQVYLKGMDYPAGRQDLITHARKNDAPETVIAALERFEERDYRSAADVSTEFGKVR
ncbi:DUF2795 domain-containing protein [Methanoculleus horonobensis]|uniref:DUF2795 domain-containing protein n=1 Tax=Methanoculleus horonobensis TaxID=528314 RepID=UPI001F44D4F0|nr:DUF2795 domain-containing protein [Methanoculleus horonobensis]MDD3070248.1 DUF2795 domain-containing protein [Methanoculleus horonobensis]MDD4252225.1 DUF2795 domain-containing protein [Methanoculleus horonobensis]